MIRYEYVSNYLRSLREVQVLNEAYKTSSDGRSDKRTAGQGVFSKRCLVGRREIPPKVSSQRSQARPQSTINHLLNYIRIRDIITLAWRNCYGER